MKIKVILLFLCLVLSIPSLVLAAGCNDAQSAAKEAMKERNEHAKSTYDTTMGSPEDDRSALGGCMDSIFSIGDAFSMGVKIPNMNQIIEGMCGQLNSLIKEKINDATSQLEEATSGFGEGPLQVNGSGDNLAKPIIGKIK